MTPEGKDWKVGSSSASTVIIKGGSINAGTASIKNPMNGSKSVVKVALVLKENGGSGSSVAKNTKLASASILELTKDGGYNVYDYGIKDVKTDDNGIVYFWLPGIGTSYKISLKTESSNGEEGKYYSNIVKVDKDITAELSADNAQNLLRSAAKDGGIYVLAANLDGTDEPLLTDSLEIKHDFTLDLNGYCLKIELARNEGNCGNGIDIDKDVTFTIQDSSNPSTGKLIVINNADHDVQEHKGAAINTAGATLIIKSGTVEVTGGYYGAGIGGGYKDDGGTVKIYGGTVKATGGYYYGAGIGGGVYGDGGTVEINGGTVNAYGGSGAASIGGGYGGDGGTITINGGTVTAAGSGAAGIGGGSIDPNIDKDVGGGTITVTGGTVTAAGGNYAAGIGGSGYGSKGGIITITGGTVTAIGGKITGDAAGDIGDIIGGGKGGSTGGSKEDRFAAGIGGGYWASERGRLIIAGGSVKANQMDQDDAAVTLGADERTPIYPVTLTLKESLGSPGIGNAMLKESQYIIRTMKENYNYRIKDIKTNNDGNVYFWLPANIYDITLSVTGVGDLGNVVEVYEDKSGTNAKVLIRLDEEAKLRKVAMFGGSFKLNYGNSLRLNDELVVMNNLTIDLNGGRLDIILDDIEKANISNGIKINRNVTLTITDSNFYYGILNVRNYANDPEEGKGAAINTTEGKLIVERVTVQARGGAFSAGIGGGKNGAGGQVEIKRGTVTANGGYGAAGIGGGYRGNGGTVIITGGTVFSAGGTYAAGIGGGDEASAVGSLIITGGSVKANRMDQKNAAKALGADNSTMLYPVTLIVKDRYNSPDGIANTILYNTDSAIKTKDGLYSYGIIDVTTDADGEICLWLSADTYSISLAAGVKRYSNSKVTVSKDYKDGANEAVLIYGHEEILLREAAADGGEYQLNADFDGINLNEPYLTECLVIENNFTLDLNGHILIIDVSEGNGIKIVNGAEFTIKDSSNPSIGKLVVTNISTGKAAINTANGKLTILSGTVEACGSAGGAGIGSDSGQDVSYNSEVVIKGGTVKAQGGANAAGIGGGYNGNGGTVKIYGGTVTALGGENAAGIGAGNSRNIKPIFNYGSLNINGGSVQIINNTAVLGVAQPQDESGNLLYMVTLTLKGDKGVIVRNQPLDGTGHKIIKNENLGGVAVNYGADSVNTDDGGKVYFWLPAGTYDNITLIADGREYSSNGSVQVIENGGNYADLTIRFNTEADWLREAINEGSSYKLRADLDDKSNQYLIEGIEISKDFILDLNGHHLMIKLSPREGEQANGIKIINNSTLTIIDTSSTSGGKLTVTNNTDDPGTADCGAAINTTEGNLLIRSGTVIAEGGNGAAGIGGNKGEAGGKVTIEGGIVIARGGN